MGAITTRSGFLPSYDLVTASAGRPVLGPGLRQVFASSAARPEEARRVEDALRAELSAATREARDIAAENVILRRRLKDAKEEIRSLRMHSLTGLSKGEKEHAIVFADDDEWVRHEIRMSWLRRFSPADRASYPLQEMLIGPEFAACVRSLPRALQAKVWRCAVDVVAGRWRELQCRSAHPLRVGSAPSTAPVVREVDKARCIRVSVESHTPAARRMHFWLLADGGVELSRVAAHDDMTP